MALHRADSKVELVFAFVSGKGRCCRMGALGMHCTGSS